MGGQMIPHRRPEIQQWGAYRLMALMEYYGHKIDPRQVRPQLMCGDVDAYASKAGRQRTFTVLYRDLEARPPKSVTLHLAGGSAHQMKRQAGTSPLHGIRFTATVTVKREGKYDFHFEATNGETKVRYPPQGDFLGPFVVAAE